MKGQLIQFESNLFQQLTIHSLQMLTLWNCENDEKGVHCWVPRLPYQANILNLGTMKPFVNSLTSLTGGQKTNN